MNLDDPAIWEEVARRDSLRWGHTKAVMVGKTKLEISAVYEKGCFDSNQIDVYIEKPEGIFEMTREGVKQLFEEYGN